MKKILTVLLSLLMITSALFGLPADAIAKTAKPAVSASQTAKKKAKAKKSKSKKKTKKSKKKASKKKSKKKATKKKSKKKTTVKKSKPAHTSHTLTVLKKTEPTCTKQGSVTYRCTGCNHSFIQYLNPLGHTPKVVEGKPATCTDDGLSDGSVCSVCGAVLKKQEFIPAHGHHYVEVLEKATLNENGWWGMECEYCADILEEREIPRLVLSLSVDPDKEFKNYTVDTLEEAKALQPAFVLKDTESGRVLDESEYDWYYSYAVNEATKRCRIYVHITIDNGEQVGTKESYINVFYRFGDDNPTEEPEESEVPTTSSAVTVKNKPQILSLTKSGSNIKVKFSTRAEFTKYVIQYSVNSSFNGVPTRSATVTVPVNSASGTATVPQLAGVSTVYFRVCAYYPLGGQGPWSYTKSIKL